MHRDGRFEPLTVLAQGVALFSVLASALIAGIRHDRPTPAGPHTFRETKHVETPWRTP